MPYKCHSCLDSSVYDGNAIELESSRNKSPLSDEIQPLPEVFSHKQIREDEKGIEAARGQLKRWRANTADRAVISGVAFPQPLDPVGSLV
jgi:hypothetical protein